MRESTFLPLAHITQVIPTCISFMHDPDTCLVSMSVNANNAVL